MADKPRDYKAWKSGTLPELDERIDKGLAMLEKLFGGLPPDAPPPSVFTDYVMAGAYADIWVRPQLDLRTRAMITVTALVISGAEEELRIHLRGLAHQGVMRQEALEIMLHLSIYAGWPIAMRGRRAVEEVYDLIEAG